MKSVCIVTNNERTAEYAGQDRRKFVLDFTKENVCQVVFRARDLLMNGWRLTADPLAGRRERANPYLTVILEKAETQEKPPGEASFEKDGSERAGVGLVGGVGGDGGEILRVEQLLSIFEQNRDRLDRLNERQKKDYAAIDLSLARSTLDKLRLPEK
ncbi:hypothetical protein [Bacilliculturomica massiliensis]|uniref:hypothetical protein n=1 Tax=Bacilliculturomica massiliensis TaxID=1917867 RepID=UPI001030987A|nr:hypothetical protein [Bacilliculturomica massiliensis]